MEAWMTDTASDAERETDGLLHGLASAEVVDNRDPDGLGRVRVRFPWYGPSDASYWARVASPMAMASRGVFFLPEVGDEVLVGFEHGDAAHPFVLGSLWNGASKPPEANGNGRNEQRLIRTRANSELRFIDGDKPSLELKLADGKKLSMDDAGITLKDGSGNALTIETQSGAISIKCSGALKLEASSVSIQAKASLELKATGTLSINGTLVKIN